MSDPTGIVTFNPYGLVAIALAKIFGDPPGYIYTPDDFDRAIQDLLRAKIDFPSMTDGQRNASGYGDIAQIDEAIHDLLEAAQEEAPRGFEPGHSSQQSEGGLGDDVPWGYLPDGSPDYEMLRDHAEKVFGYTPTNEEIDIWIGEAERTGQDTGGNNNNNGNGNGNGNGNVDVVSRTVDTNVDLGDGNNNNNNNDFSPFFNFNPTVSVTNTPEEEPAWWERILDGVVGGAAASASNITQLHIENKFDAGRLAGQIQRDQVNAQYPGTNVYEQMQAQQQPRPEGEAAAIETMKMRNRLAEIQMQGMYQVAASANSAEDAEARMAVAKGDSTDTFAQPTTAQQLLEEQVENLDADTRRKIQESDLIYQKRMTELENTYNEHLRHELMRSEIDVNTATKDQLDAIVKKLGLESEILEVEKIWKGPREAAGIRSALLGHFAGADLLMPGTGVPDFSSPEAVVGSTEAAGDITGAGIGTMLIGREFLTLVSRWLAFRRGPVPERPRVLELPGPGGSFPDIRGPTVRIPPR